MFRLYVWPDFWSWVFVQLTHTWLLLFAQDVPHDFNNLPYRPMQNKTRQHFRNEELRHCLKAFELERMWLLYNKAISLSTGVCFCCEMNRGGRSSTIFGRTVYLSCVQRGEGAWKQIAWEEVLLLLLRLMAWRRAWERPWLVYGCVSSEDEMEKESL